MTAMPELEAAPVIAVPPHLNRIVLMGFMGAGKSTIGRLLAAELGWTFLDLDTLLEARAGASIPDLFALHGEAHFRRLESSALAAALGMSRVVLALGGGTPELLTNRLLLEQTPETLPVFLNAPFETVYDRCLLQALDRPVLADPILARARFVQRQPLYRRLARLTLDTELHTPTQTLERMRFALRTQR